MDKYLRKLRVQPNLGKAAKDREMPVVGPSAMCILIVPIITRLCGPCPSLDRLQAPGLIRIGAAGKKEEGQAGASQVSGPTPPFLSIKINNCTHFSITELAGISPEEVNYHSFQ